MKYLIGFLDLFLERNVDQGLEEAWSELALVTSLTYEPPDHESLFSRYSAWKTPKVDGEYRGHYLSLARAPNRWSDWDPIVTNTEIWLELKNAEQYTLAILLRTKFDGWRAGNEISSGNEDFDQRFTINGQPQEFVLAAAGLMGRAEPRLLEWMIEYHPKFKLERSYLVCTLGRLIDIQIQIDLLNLLCDLADLVEIGAD